MPPSPVEDGERAGARPQDEARVWLAVELRRGFNADGTGGAKERRNPESTGFPPTFLTVMHPILATTALSAAGDIVQNLASRIGKGPAQTAPTAAPAVPFVTLVDKASAPTPANLALHTQDLQARLGRSVEVVDAMNQAGVSGPASLQIDANGDSALRLPNGTLKPIQLSEEMRGVARELHQLRQPLATSATVERPAGPVTVSIS